MAKLNRMTGADFQQKHAKNLKAATHEITAGVNAVTEAPGKKAAARKDVWVNRMTDTTVHDRWAKNVGKVTLEDWKKDMVEKGVGRISAGLDRSANKIADFGEKLLTFQKSAKGEFDKIRPLTIDEAADKAAKWIKKMGEFSYKK